jgi:hypothetical protein
LRQIFEDFTMSAPSTQATDNHAVSPNAVEQDAVEAIVPMMPIILPLVGGVTMLLIAFIAVFMA